MLEPVALEQDSKTFTAGLLRKACLLFGLDQPGPLSIKPPWTHVVTIDFTAQAGSISIWVSYPNTMVRVGSVDGSAYEFVCRQAVTMALAMAFNHDTIVGWNQAEDVDNGDYDYAALDADSDEPDEPDEPPDEEDGAW